MGCDRLMIGRPESVMPLDAAGAKDSQRDIFVSTRWECFMSQVNIHTLAVLPCCQQSIHSRFPPLNLLSLLTRLWLDDIFNLFVQRSLAHWGNKKERCPRRKMSRHRNTFVSGCVLCVAVIYGSSYVWDMKVHSSHSSSVCGSRRISMWHWGNTSRWTSLHGTARHFQHIRLSFSGSKVLASDFTNTVFFNSKMCQQSFGWKTGLRQRKNTLLSCKIKVYLTCSRMPAEPFFHCIFQGWGITYT